MDANGAEVNTGYWDNMLYFFPIDGVRSNRFMQQSMCITRGDARRGGEMESVT